MAVQLVRVVLDNGRTSEVAETHPALVDGTLKLAPSARPEDQPVNLAPEEGGAEPLPARNASTEAWQDYAKRRGMPPEEAEAMSRDELVAHYTSEE